MTTTLPTVRTTSEASKPIRPVVNHYNFMTIWFFDSLCKGSFHLVANAHNLLQLKGMAEREGF